MNFALKHALATFLRPMDVILSSLKWQIALVYLDDIVVFLKKANKPHGTLATSIDKASGCRGNTQAEEVLIFCKEN